MKKTLALLMAIMMLLGLLAGCNTTPDPTDAPTDAPKPTEAPKDDPTEAPEDPTEAPAAEPNYLRMAHGMVNATKSGFWTLWTCFNNDTIGLIWETIIGYDTTTGEFVKILAEDYSVSEDGKTWTVNLKKDVKWHDGEPLTSEDIAYSYAAMIGAAGSGSTHLTNLKGYEAVSTGAADRFEGITCPDDYTVVFEFTQPNFMFEETMAYLGYSIVPAHCFEGMSWAEMLESEYWVAPIGSGPYKVNETKWPDYVTLTANENWHKGMAGIKDILLLIYEDAAATLAASMAGELDIRKGLSEEDATSITTAQPQLKTTVMEAGYTRMFVLNQMGSSRPEMRDVRVRKAINMIVDKQMIVDYIGIQASVATTFSAMDYNTDIPTWTRDVEGGKKLLEEAGFDFTRPIILYTNYTDQQTIDIFDIIVANFAEAGVTVEYISTGDNAVAKIYEIRDYDIYYGGTLGLHYQMYNCWATGALYDAWYAEDTVASRTERYNNLMDQYRGTTDVALRKQILDQIQVNSMEDMYLIAVWYRNDIWAVNERLTGFACYANDYATMHYPDVTAWSLAE